MMTLQEVRPIAQRLRGEEYIDTTTVAAIRPDTPMACESYVADAVCHLFSGLLIVEDHRTSSPPVSGPQTPLGCSSRNIATKSGSEANLGCRRLTATVRENPPSPTSWARCTAAMPPDASWPCST